VTRKRVDGDIVFKWFKKREQKKKRQRYFEEGIEQSKYPDFLKQIDVAIIDLLRDYPDDDTLLSKLGEEASRWFTDMPHLNLTSFKAGVVYGMFLLLRHRKQRKRESYVV